jgi:uncharacterized membrane protein
LGIKHIETKEARTSQLNGLQRTRSPKKKWVYAGSKPRIGGFKTADSSLDHLAMREMEHLDI